NTQQAEALDSALAEEGRAIDSALYVEVGKEELVKRLAGRWTCPNCSAVYHDVNHPPQQAGVCDNCKSALAQRDDDKPDVVRKRIEIQFENLEPLLDYYRRQGKLSEVDGQRDPAAVTADLQKLIAA
ncbi:MAG: nucleoside monophosphate kinase, partial [Dehalococcoidia bacterium]